MSSLCGIVDFEKRKVEFSRLHEMGRAMILRGQDQSGAYLSGGVGLYHNRALGGEEEESRQPYTVLRGGHAYTVMMDGVLHDSRTASGRFSLLDFSSAAEAVLEAYLSFGLSFAPYVQGEFAFALYDAYRGEVILGRSAEGKCPLYYSYTNGRLCFASEVKGMMRALDGSLTVDGDALRRHLLSPMGDVDACEIYPSLCEVPAGHVLVVSRIDAVTIPLPPDGGAEDSVGEVLIPSPTEAVPLVRCLDEALTAFDYPVFDAEMPIYLGAVKRARENKTRTARIWDGTRRENLSYARRREDRLGGLYGVLIQGVTPPEPKRSGKTWRTMERQLNEHLETLDSYAWRHLYGDDAVELAGREKDPARRIRMLGILCQSEAWLERYPLLISHRHAV